MQETFDIALYDGHLIFHVGNMKVLVDTGSPVTIGKENSFDFLGEKYVCHTAFLGKDINSISQLMNYDIDVLMGMDIMEKYYIRTDYQQQQITFSDEPFSVDQMFSTPITRMMGAVCIDLVIDGNTVKVALDTGARISYIDQAFTEGKHPIDERDDFNPAIGHFQTPIFEIEATVGDSSFPVNFGVLPPILAMPLQMIGISGAIGFDLFNVFTVVLDFRNNILYMQ